MDNKLRAEKIADTLRLRDSQRDYVLANLDEAVADAVREAILKEYEGDCSNVARIEQEAYKKGFASARERAAGDLGDLIAEHYDEYKNDCAFCGAMLTPCKNDCIIPELLKLAESIRAMQPDGEKCEHGGSLPCHCIRGDWSTHERRKR